MTLDSMTLADQDMSASQYRTHLVAVQPYIRRHAAVLRVVGTELAVVIGGADRAFDNPVGHALVLFKIRRALLGSGEEPGVGFAQRRGLVLAHTPSPAFVRP